MNGKPHKGSWGDRYIIEQKPNNKRITCNFCKYYDEDGSCRVKPIVVCEVGYDYWKYCDAFYLSDEHNTTENQARAIRSKKIKSTYVEKTSVVGEIGLKENLCRNIKSKEVIKKVKLGSSVWVYDMNYDVKELFEFVSSEDADIIKGKISITSPVGKGLLNAEEGDVCKISTPGGIVKYKVLEIK